MRSARLRTTSLVLPFAALLAAGCADQGLPSSPARDIADAGASPSVSTGGPITVGQSLQLKSPLAEAARKKKVTITWTSLDRDVATVTTSGFATGRAVGTARVVSSAKKLRPDTMKVQVVAATPAPSAVASVSVSLASASVEVGKTTQATAVVKDAAGKTIEAAVTWSSSNTSAATVSSAGVVTAVAAGNATITAKSGEKSGSVAITVTAAGTTPKPDTTTTPKPDTTTTPTPNPTPTPTPPTYSPSPAAMPALPRAQVNTSYPAVTGRTVQVPAGASLQAAIDAAQPGDELVLAAGATYTGPFTLPKKAGSGVIVIRSSTVPTAAGQRVTPRHAAQMPKLVGGAGNVSVLTTAPGASNYRLVGLEIALASGVSSLNSLVRLGDANADQVATGTMPQNLILDRMYIHGTATAELTRCVMLNSGASAIIDSHLSDCHNSGADSQAILGWNGSGPYRIENNYLEAAGEIVMFGGAIAATPGLVPSDIEFRRNHLRKPQSWVGGPWVIKNIFELKFARRVLVEGNILEGNWQQAQTGYAMNLKSSADFTWAVTEDVTVRYNRIRNTGAGFSLSGKEGTAQTAARRIAITDNVLENVNVAPYTGHARLVQAINGVTDVTIDHNTFVSSAQINSALALGGSAVQRLTFRNNIVSRGDYGVKGDGSIEGTPSLTTWNPAGLFEANLVIGSTSATYPATTRFASSMSAVGFANPSGGDYRLSSSSVAGTGSDGRVLGVDMAKLDQATAGVIVP